jgi:hypothetical protein
MRSLRAANSSTRSSGVAAASAASRRRRPASAPAFTCSSCRRPPQSRGEPLNGAPQVGDVGISTYLPQAW